MAKIKFFTGILILSIIFGTIFGVGQQILRQSANDPQIQLVEDGTVPQESINIIHSLAPFVVIYDSSGRSQFGNGYFNNQLAQLPQGIFAYVKEHGQDRITWQPQTSLRYAIVVARKDGGFIMAGRSLREVEAREQKLMEMVGLAWIVAMAGFSFALLVAQISKKK